MDDDQKFSSLKKNLIQNTTNKTNQRVLIVNFLFLLTKKSGHISKRCSSHPTCGTCQWVFKSNQNVHTQFSLQIEIVTYQSISNKSTFSHKHKIVMQIMNGKWKQIFECISSYPLWMSLLFHTFILCKEMSILLPYYSAINVIACYLSTFIQFVS